jgi:simple sugar transport system ATP-binding protein
VSEGLLQARGLTLRFGPVLALDRVSLTMQPGEVTCLVGTSGCGKSVLAHLLAGLHGAQEGEVLLEGEPVDLRHPAAARAAGIGVAFQDPALVLDLTVAQNLHLGCEPMRGVFPFRRVDRAAANGKAAELLATLGLNQIDPELPAGRLDLAGRRLLTVARAIQTARRILILDEPTAGLRLDQAALVVKAMRAAREQGLAVLFVTQNLQHGWSVADRFSVLYRGRMLGSVERADTRREELFTLMTGGDESMEIEAELGNYQSPENRRLVHREAASALVQMQDAVEIRTNLVKDAAAGPPVPQTPLQQRLAAAAAAPRAAAAAPARTRPPLLRPPVPAATVNMMRPPGAAPEAPP